MPTTKKTADVSVVDQLADDVAAETTPEEYPEGAPELKPYLQIRPRSKRAKFKRKYAEFAPLRKEVERIKLSGVFDGIKDGEAEEAPEQVAEKLRAWADVDDYYQLIDELLVLAAVDEDAYRAWSDEVEDPVLTETFAVYMKRAQPGEASSSAS